jgi:uncharacterized FlaG/YvyC family protein
MPAETQSISTSSSATMPIMTKMTQPVNGGGGASIDQPHKVYVTDIPKVDIKVDTETMMKNLQSTLDQLNNELRDGGRGVSFSIDKSLPAPVVVVRNTATGEVIRQFPNEAVVSFADNLQGLKGLLANSIV